MIFYSCLYRNLAVRYAIYAKLTIFMAVGLIQAEINGGELRADFGASQGGSAAIPLFERVGAV